MGPDKASNGPADPQQLNRFSYVSNNPVKNTDPTGHCTTCVGAAIGAAVGGALFIASAVRAGGFDIRKGNQWLGLATAMVAGGTAGALLATPGLQGVGLSMAANLVADHTTNLIDGKVLDPVQHGIAAATGGLSGVMAGGLSAVSALNGGSPVVMNVSKAAFTGFIGLAGGAVNAAVHNESYAADKATADFTGNVIADVGASFLPTGGPRINRWEKTATMGWNEFGAGISSQEAAAIGTSIGCKINQSC